jgi:NhaP-type Na+/H+ or K+/H+ antiporter
MINDAKLLDDFWALTEHLLNNVLFLLGGAVWGFVIADGEQTGIWQAREWGYLFLLYFLLTAIRLALFAAVYPITSRIGLHTNWKETVFQVYGGLRGAVGIALAISLDNSVGGIEGADSRYADQTKTAFGMIGGIAFLTLVINGSTSGPLLKKFGLADSTASREKIVECYQARFKRSLQLEFVSLLTQRRFRQINFGLVKAHVPYLADMTRAQLAEAIDRHKDITATEDYNPPYLHGVLPYLSQEQPEETASGTDTKSSMPASKSTEDLLKSIDPDGYARKADREKRTENRNKRRRNKSTMQFMMAGEPLSAQEMRALFISILRSNYEKQIEHGEMADQEFLAIALQQSLDFAADAVANGGPLQGTSICRLLCFNLDMSGC